MRINNAYQYESEDIQAILECHVNRIQKTYPDAFRKPILVMAAASNDQKDNSLKLILEADKKAQTRERILLIPCRLYLGNSNGQDIYHWVGLLLEFNNDNEIKHALYLDSIESTIETHREYIDPIDQQLRQVYPGQTWTPTDCLQQDDETSCGTYVIENLLRHSRVVKPNTVKTTQQLRAKDLASLKKGNESFFNSFNLRQRNNIPTVQATMAPKVAPEEINNLNTTIVALHSQIENYFSGEASAFPAENIKAINKKFHTIFNKETGALELQPKNITAVEGMSSFMATRIFRDRSVSALKDYTPGMAAGFVGGSAAVGVSSIFGLGEGYFTVSEAVAVGRAAIVADGMASGMMVGARALISPWTLGPGVALMGASAAKTYFSRAFASSIHTAIDLYHDAKEPDDVKLVEAENIIQNELGNGVNSRSVVTKTLCWLSTPTNQYEFAYLLLAQIRAKQGLPEALNMFDKVLKESKNSTLKAMSLVGKINIYSKQKTCRIMYDGCQVNLSEADTKSFLEQQIDLLNKEHKEVIQSYFKAVWDAYSVMYEVITNANFLKSEEEFSDDRKKIEKIINFKDINCMRYMEPHGHMAMVVFSFVQGLAHVAMEEQYRKLDITSKDKAISKSRTNEQRLAMEKFNECKSFMEEFDLEDPQDAKDLGIIRTIMSYKEGYFKKYMEEKNNYSNNQVCEIKTVHSTIKDEDKITFVNNLFKNTGIDKAQEQSTRSKLRSSGKKVRFVNT